MSGETSGPHEKLEGFDLDSTWLLLGFAHALIYDRKQQEAHDEVLVQDSNLGHVAVLYPDCADCAAG
jgi:hypothetical protein